MRVLGIFSHDLRLCGEQGLMLIDPRKEAMNQDSAETPYCETRHGTRAGQDPGFHDYLPQ
jgi:hypothetical protein